MKKVIRIINGTFGKRTLVEPYRSYWQIFTWGTVVFIIFRFIMCPMFELWDKFLVLLNHIIWG